MAARRHSTRLSLQQPEQDDRQYSFPPSTTATATASASAMPPPALPPQTPTRALLNRIRRRSQVATSSSSSSSSSTSTSGSSLHPLQHRPASQSLDLRRSSLSHTARTDNDDDDGDEHVALEKQVDALLEAGESKDKIIADLKRNNAELRAELKMQKQLVEELKQSNKKRLNQQTLSNLEQEFHQQENILQGLQRDNEEKTIEIERVKRKDKVLTDYLLKLHGEDWPNIVSSAVGGASVLPVSALGSSTSGPPTASSSAAAGESGNAVARVFATAASSRSLNTANLERSLSTSHKRDSLSGHLSPPLPPLTPVRGVAAEREVHFSSSPSKIDGGSNWGDASFVSAIGDSSTFHLPSLPSASAPSDPVKGEAYASSKERTLLSSSRSSDNSASAGGAGITLSDSGGNGTVSIQQLDVLRASIESTRLLVQGYLRSDATRRTKLDQMVEVAERRAKEFEGVVSAH
ncbi:hypothetical protein A4X06_0g868 [Tilletia controversa]|uniref:Uncharacterized protein n=1 Tax=Tilletia controversa TaxID=13291 RepID=A0A8X7N0J6_9BASI|nr:hypothetical protein A4X06_0g868 [Tilletia controversa]